MKVLPNGYALLSNNNIWLISRKGEIIYQKFFEQKSKIDWGRILIGTAGIVGGVLFQDEMAEFNRQAYKEGLIDADEAWDNAWTMTVFRGGSGSGLVGGAYAQDLYTRAFGNNRNKTVKGTNMDAIYLRPDELEKGKHGLRVFDLNTGKEKKTIWLSGKSDFYYFTSNNMEGMPLIRDNALCFYQL